AAIVAKFFGGAGQRMGKVAEQTAVAAPVAPHRSAIDVVPLRPAGRKATELIASGANVPRFGNELDVGEHRVLPNRCEERRMRVKSRRAPERRGQIEAEAVDVKHLDPV